MRASPQAGFSLLETLVALFLTGLAVLAAAPMFIHASHAQDAAADMGEIGALAVDRMERLRTVAFRDLTAGGSLSTNLSGFNDNSNPDYYVRWIVQDVGSPATSKVVTVAALARVSRPGPRRQVELTVVRSK